jgi:hypothetical protein
VDKILLKVLETALQPIVVLLTSIDAKLGNGAPGFVPAPAPTAAPAPAAPAAATATIVTEGPKDAIPVITREALGQSLIAIAKVDMQKAKDILSQFKAAQLADVAAADYPALAEAIKKAAAAPVKQDPKDLLG